MGTERISSEMLNGDPPEYALYSNANFIICPGHIIKLCLIGDLTNFTICFLMIFTNKDCTNLAKICLCHVDLLKTVNIPFDKVTN